MATPLHKPTKPFKNYFQHILTLNYILQHLKCTQIFNAANLKQYFDNMPHGLNFEAAHLSTFQNPCDTSFSNSDISNGNIFSIKSYIFKGALAQKIHSYVIKTLHYKVTTFVMQVIIKYNGKITFAVGRIQLSQLPCLWRLFLRQLLPDFSLKQYGIFMGIRPHFGSLFFYAQKNFIFLCKKNKNYVQK